MVKRIIIAICTAASIVGIAFIPGIPEAWTIVLVVVSFIFLIILLIPDAKEKLTICKSDEEIRRYMVDWIKQKGQVKLLSRDLSWVESDSVALDIIRKKARDITIYAQCDSPLIQELKKFGVKVILYGHLTFEPVTRFTIIRSNKPDKQIAIAKTQSSKKGKFKHTIYQTGVEGDDRDKWLISLAQDITNLLDAAIDKKC